MLRALFPYLLRAALADRLIQGLVVALAGTAALAAFFGSMAVVEKRELAVVYGAAGGRLVVTITLVLFTCFHIRRAFDGGEIDLLLARPISRGAFVLAHVGLLALLATAAAGLAGLAVAALARPALPALLLWTGSLALEATIIAVAALFFALMLASGVLSALACFGFYVLARTLGLLTASARGGDGGVLDGVLSLLLLVLPRFDLLGDGSWLVHGVVDASAVPALIQGVVYLVVLGAAASFDFERRPL